MAYRPLDLPSSLPKSARFLLRDGLDPILNDIHCMLRLPISSAGLNAGCNISIALSLLSVIAGVSATCYRENLSDGASFAGLLQHYYPWELEREAFGNNTDNNSKVRALWRTFRNPLSHSLGLMFEKRGQRGRVFDPKRFVVMINRERAGASEEQIEALELGEPRPHMRSTIEIGEDYQMLSIEPLYWGVRVMLHRLANDFDQMKIVDMRISAGMEAFRSRPNQPDLASK